MSSKGYNRLKSDGQEESPRQRLTITSSTSSPPRQRLTTTSTVSASSPPRQRLTTTSSIVTLSPGGSDFDGGSESVFPSLAEQNESKGETQPVTVNEPSDGGPPLTSEGGPPSPSDGGTPLPSTPASTSPSYAGPTLSSDTRPSTSSAVTPHNERSPTFDNAPTPPSPPASPKPNSPTKPPTPTKLPSPPKPNNPPKAPSPQRTNDSPIYPEISGHDNLPEETEPPPQKTTVYLSEEVDVEDAVPLLKNEEEAELDPSSLLYKPQPENTPVEREPCCLPRCLKSNCCTGLVGCAMILSFLLFGLIHYVVLPGFREKVHEKVTISKTSYDWISPKVDTTLFCYFYNVTNAKEISSFGAKASLKELGPYVYTIYVERTNLTFNDNDTVSYRTAPTFVFDRERSVGSEYDLVTTVDIPTVAVHAVSGGFISNILNWYFTLDDAFQTLTIKKLMWGYHSSNLAKILQKLEKYSTLPGMNNVIEQIPKTVGYFYEKNGTAGDLINVFTGAKDFSKFNDVHAWNGLDKFPYWATKKANTIRGSDGAMFNPFSDRRSNLTFFSPELFRAFDLKYQGQHFSKGIECMRFVIPDSQFTNTTMSDELPEATRIGNLVKPSDTPRPNGRFSPKFNSSILESLSNDNSSFPSFQFPDDDYFDSEDYDVSDSPDQDSLGIQTGSLGGFCRPKCIPSGMYSLEPITHGPIPFPAPPGTPLFISLPHLLGADPATAQEVEGLNPIEYKHRPYFDIDDVTGAVVSQSRRYQLNIRLMNNPETLVPLFWVDTIAEIGEGNAADIRLAHLAYHAFYVMRYFLLGLGGMCFLVLVCQIIRKRCSKADDEESLHSDTDEDEKEGRKENKESNRESKESEGNINTNSEEYEHRQTVTIPCAMCKGTHTHTVPDKPLCTIN